MYLVEFGYSFITNFVCVIIWFNNYFKRHYTRFTRFQKRYYAHSIQRQTRDL